ncbi:uncharacterized protein LOC143196134 isoform X2 [Rhynchophorus ferrugineus]|uniref:uncharacterized protein LOC143196134 isoform X2 n=1 Tax=Rhynchophorus ferrugineus TaxID=354439 RepID=UPI003FCC9AF9
MTRWAGESPRKPPPGPPDPRRVTDDPLAALGLNTREPSDLQVYAVSRVNPLFNLPPKGLFDQHYSPPDRDDRKCTTRSTKRRYDEFDVREKSPEIDYEDDPKSALRHSSVSSGYSGSSISENGFGSRLRPVEEVAVLDQNPAFVKSIRIAGRGLRTTKLAPSQHSSSSGAGTLSTIPEGRVDASLHSRTEMGLDISIRDLLMDLLTSIGQARSPEDALRKVDEKIRRQLEMLRCVTEEDMRRLCVSLSRGRQVNSVLRALSRSPSSGQSSNSGRVRSSSIQEEDFYHIPSGSSSSGFSDSPPGQRRPPTPLSYGRKPSISLGNFPAEESSTLSRGIRNALIYGTLYRQKTSPAKEPTAACDSDLAHSDKMKNCDRKDLLEPEALTTKMGHLESARDNKPSVWEMYYGVKAEGSGRYGQGRPSDVPIFPGGRPEADFTLDVPRSELLSKRLKEDKKWRFRCRLLTSFLGLVFFLLSVMAVSMILTRGKRMFGSMV